MPGPLRVDAHQHVWDRAGRPQPWTPGVPELQRSFSLADARSELAAHHFDATILVQTLAEPDETRELLALAAREPVVAGVVGWADLTDPDITTRLTASAAEPGGASLVGIRHRAETEPDPRWLCRRDVRRGLTAVADAGLAFDLLIRPAQLPAAVEAAGELPQLRFVLDHGGKPDIAAGGLEPWASDIADLSLMPNVAVKLSGLVTQADHDAWTVEQLRPYADVLLEAFGPDRIMFGSDWPVCLLAASYDVWVATATALTAGLSEAERHEVFGGTAARWYRLAP